LNGKCSHNHSFKQRCTDGIRNAQSNVDPGLAMQAQHLVVRARRDDSCRDTRFLLEQLWGDLYLGRGAVDGDLIPLQGVPTETEGVQTGQSASGPVLIPFQKDQAAPRDPPQLAQGSCIGQVESARVRQDRQDFPGQLHFLCQPHVPLALACVITTGSQDGRDLLPMFF
jgi:hypothetical protein